MTYFSSDIHALFKHWGHESLLSELEVSHDELISRRKKIVEFGNPDTITPIERAASNCQLLQQTLLYRAERLLTSCPTMLDENNVYGLALLVRGHFESAAMLGYFCDRLKSLAAGNVKFEDFEWNIADAMMGAKHAQFKEARPPLNIMTCIDRADKYYDQNFLKQKKGIIRDCYDWLSEFAHPNFLSNVSGFTLDKENGRFVMRDAGEIRKEDFQLPQHMQLGCEIFLYFFDVFTENLAQANLTPQGEPASRNSETKGI